MFALLFSDVHLTLNAGSGGCLGFFFLNIRCLFSPSKWRANKYSKKKKKSRRCAVYLVPSAKYGYTFEAPLKCKETQAACSLRRLNRASFFCACTERVQRSVNAAFVFVFFFKLPFSV